MLVGRFSEATEATANGHVPGSDEVSIFLVTNRLPPLDVLERAFDLGRQLADIDENERPATETPGVVDRVGSPQVELALPIPERGAERINRRLAVAVETEFAGQRPARRG